MANWLHPAALLVALVVAARIGAVVFERLRQPRVAGEIFAGLALAYLAAGAQRLQPAIGAWLTGSAATTPSTLGAVSLVGSMLLMFFAGTELRAPAGAQERRELAALSLVDFGLPILVTLALAPLLPLELLRGTATSDVALVLVVAIGMAVTSVPVISKIFHDLGILSTRFATLVLSAAVVGDAGLWVILAIATALAKQNAASVAATVVWHFVLSGTYLVLGVLVLPRRVRALSASPGNRLARELPLLYLALIVTAYLVGAHVVEVNMAFGAFLAGLAIGRDPRLEPFTSRLRPLAFAALIPAYFAIAGFRIRLDGGTAAWILLGAFLLISSAVKIGASTIAARLVGFRGLEVANLAIALNARGGPGIIVATIALDAGIVSAPFYSALVLTAVLTSQAAGAWLRYVLHRGWPLVRGATPASERGAT